MKSKPVTHFLECNIGRHKMLQFYNIVKIFVNILLGWLLQIANTTMSKDNVLHSGLGGLQFEYTCTKEWQIIHLKPINNMNNAE